MKKLLFSTTQKVHWLPENGEVKTYICDELPRVELCSSTYALVFKDGALLQTDLREGERPARMLDIPGGHVDEGEDLETATIRETFEETGVRVNELRLAGYKEIIIHGPKPEGYRYPYPVSYMLFYLANVAEETEFAGNDEVHGRVWLAKGEYEKSPWYLEEKAMVDEIMRQYVNPMKRIAVIGISGAGKSTFANKLGKNLSREVIHLDQEYWTDEWKKRYSTKEEWNDFLRETVAKDTWILDGNYQSSFDIRLKRADTIIFFDLPKWRCLWRSFIRVFDRMKSFDPAKQKISGELVKRILNYPRADLKKMVENYKDITAVYTVRNNKEINVLLSKLSARQ